MSPAVEKMKPRDRVLAALAGEPTDRPPVCTPTNVATVELMDLVGIDVNYTVSCSVYEQMGRPARLKPHPIQAELFDGGQFGRKAIAMHQGARRVQEKICVHR